MSTDTRAINKQIAQIEIQGLKYGLKLNKAKCEVLTSADNPNINFQDGKKIKIKDTVTYLGCDINKNGDIKREVSKRISNAMTTLKRLDLFWRHSNCPVKFKLIALDATLRSKLLYLI